jgi:RHS repeat protein
MSRLMKMARIAGVVTLLLAGPAHPLGAQSDGATYTYDALGRLIQVIYGNGTTMWRDPGLRRVASGVMARQHRSRTR